MEFDYLWSNSAQWFIESEITTLHLIYEGTLQNYLLSARIPFHFIVEKNYKDQVVAVKFFLF